MTRRIAFALTALVLTLATGVTAALAGPTRSSAEPASSSRVGSWNFWVQARSRGGLVRFFRSSTRTFFLAIPPG